MEVGLGPGDVVGWGPSYHRKKAHHPTQFLAHVCCGQTAGWIKMPLGTEANFGPGDVVLDGVAAPPKRGRASPVFGSCLLWPSGWMVQDATHLVYRVDLGPGHIILDGSRLSEKGAQQPPLFGLCLFLCPRSSISATAELLLTRPIRERFRGELLMIKRYTNALYMYNAILYGTRCITDAQKLTVATRASLHGVYTSATDRGDRSRDRSPRRSPRVNTPLVFCIESNRKLTKKTKLTACCNVSRRRFLSLSIPSFPPPFHHVEFSV